jgi:hypothetical protein
VICVATAAGKRLLDDADPVVDRADETAMEALSAKQVAELIALLDRIRSANAARGAPRSALKR